VHLICLQHVSHDAAHHADLSTTADPCILEEAEEENQRAAGQPTQAHSEEDH